MSEYSCNERLFPRDDDYVVVMRHPTGWMVVKRYQGYRTTFAVVLFNEARQQFSSQGWNTVDGAAFTVTQPGRTKRALGMVADWVTNRSTAIRRFKKVCGILDEIPRTAYATKRNYRGGGTVVVAFTSRPARDAWCKKEGGHMVYHNDAHNLLAKRSVVGIGCYYRRRPSDLEKAASILETEVMFGSIEGLPDKPIAV